MLDRQNKKNESKVSQKSPKRRTDGFRVGILEDWRGGYNKKGPASNRGNGVRDGR